MTTPLMFFNKPGRLAQAQLWAQTWNGGNANDNMDLALRFLLGWQGHPPGTDTAAGSQVAAAVATFNISDAQLNGVGCDLYKDNDWVCPCRSWVDAIMTDAQKSQFESQYGHCVSVIQSHINDGTGTGTHDNFFGNYSGAYKRNEAEWAWLHSDHVGVGGVFDWLLANRWDAAPNGVWSINFKSWANETNPENWCGMGAAPCEGSEYGPAFMSWHCLPMAISVDMGRDLSRGAGPTGETDYFFQNCWFTQYNTLWGDPLGAKGFVAGDDEHAYDSYRYPYNTNRYLGTFMSFMAYYYPTDPVGKAAFAWQSRVNAPAQTWIRSVFPTSAGTPPTLPLDYMELGHGYCISKDSWNDNGMTVLMQLRLGEGGHRHGDAGSFQIFLNGDWITRETSGYEVQLQDAWIKDTRCHNCLTVGGSLFGGGDGQVWTLSKDNGWWQYAQSQPDWFYAASAIDGCYGSSSSSLDNPEMTHYPTGLGYIREFLVIRSLKCVIVRDVVQTVHSTTPKTFRLHSANSWTLGSTVFRGASNRMVATVLKPTISASQQYENPDPCGGQGQPPCVNPWDCTPQYRLDLLATDNQAITEFLVVIQAKSQATDPDVVVTLNGNVLHVGTHQIDFVARTYDGVALTNGMQPFTADRNGCRWL